ncbi:MAG: adenosylmethionine decarboxylase [bacterium]|nr:adenosylmethionine decarboxylase [bacterium]
MENVNNIFVKVYGVNEKRIENLKFCSNLLEDIAQTLNYTILDRTFHKFKPQGLTGVLLLAQSHLSLHTWPETQFVVIEMVTCQKFTPREEKILCKIIKKHLSPKRMKIIINR